MLNTEFYDILDAELTQLVEANGFNEDFKDKQDDKKKGYALLMWFLKLYGQTQAYQMYITDGPNDASCDIIFDLIDGGGKKIFYVVQSKWRKKSNCGKQISATEFKAALEDFQLILIQEKRKTNNKNFNRKYDELREHITRNGDVKFIYFALCEHNPTVDDSVASFQKNYGSQLEVIDINRTKRDYVNFHYKQIIINNPLENTYIPEGEIEIEIEQLGHKNNFLKIDRPFASYILLIRPKTAFEIFSKYKYQLFFKNVRNPLIGSPVNNNIEATLQHEVPYFWYYNNGVTAITSGIVGGKITPAAKSIQVIGLQIINGAQTIYSVYNSYLHASESERRIMDMEAYITVRLLTINTERESFKITRYTNSQNPMEDRDFWANDEVQIRLQDESLDTNYWYEKRRGEFVSVPKNVKVIPNKVFAICHLSFNLGRPHDIKGLFISYYEDDEGIYEQIFNNGYVSFKEMLAAYLFVNECVSDFENNIDEYEMQTTLIYFAISRILLDKYLQFKFSPDINTAEYIISKYESEGESFNKIFGYTVLNIANHLNIDRFSDLGTLYTIYKDEKAFERVKKHFRKIEMTDEIIQEIEQIDLDNPIQN